MKVLIIKLGYSETLDLEIGRVPSLGDVLRTTPILWALKEKYSESHITWLVDVHAEPLLINNMLIDRILVWDSFVPFQLMKEKFDVLINFEKIPGVCALADMIDAWVKYGFRFESIDGTYHAYENGLDFINYIEEKIKTNKPTGVWQQVLIEMLGVTWKEQEYIIGYKPKTKEIYDIGLNYKVGAKWPHKAMSQEKWKDLEKILLDLGYTVSWQQGLKNLYEYMDWINSCRLIISSDSLGLHLAYAFKKKAVGLFGPTDPREVYFYGDGKTICAATGCVHMPCYGERCITGFNCMDAISLDEIVGTVKAMLGFGEAIQK
ncbi:MAG TPA: glycosyl transferase [Deltaproteobacteria bacterium]|nr:glycosyl transferase [Deltaproteobacteria bacterium]